MTSTGGNGQRRGRSVGLDLLEPRPLVMAIGPRAAADALANAPYPWEVDVALFDTPRSLRSLSHIAGRPVIVCTFDWNDEGYWPGAEQVIARARAESELPVVLVCSHPAPASDRRDAMFARMAKKLDVFVADAPSGHLTRTAMIPLIAWIQPFINAVEASDIEAVIQPGRTGCAAHFRGEVGDVAGETGRGVLACVAVPDVTNVLMCVTSNEDLDLCDMNAVTAAVVRAAGDDVNIIFSAATLPGLQDEVGLNVLAIHGRR